MGGIDVWRPQPPLQLLVQFLVVFLVQLDVESGPFVGHQAVSRLGYGLFLLGRGYPAIIVGHSATVAALMVGAVGVCVALGTVARYHWQRQEYRRCQVKYRFAVSVHQLVFLLFFGSFFSLFFLLGGKVGDTGTNQDVIPRDDSLDVVVVNAFSVPILKNTVHELV